MLPTLFPRNAHRLPLIVPADYEILSRFAHGWPLGDACKIDEIGWG